MRIGVLFLACLLICTCSAVIAGPGDDAAVSAVSLPRLFTLNEGQWDARIRAASAGVGPTVSFGAQGYSVGLKHVALSTESGNANHWPGLRFLNSEKTMQLRAGQTRAGISRWYGNRNDVEPGKAIPQYRSVIYEGVWPGVDVEIEGSASALWHHLEIAVQQAPEEVTLRFDNIHSSQIQANSDRAKIRLQESNGGVDVTIVPDAMLQSVSVSIGLNFFWGGSGSDGGKDILVDRAGNLHITGWTGSADFPLVPANQSEPGYSSKFVMKCSPDGQQIFYSTVFNSPQSGDLWLETPAIGRDDRLVFTLYSNALMDLLTPNAEYRATAGCGMFVLDSSGAILYGTALPEQRIGYHLLLQCDRDGVIYFLTTTDQTPACITPDALFRQNQGGRDGLLMKFDATDFRLKYATCLGTKNDDYFESFAIDGCGGVGYVNVYFDSSAIAPDSVRVGWYAYDIARISADGGSFIFRRSFSGGIPADFGGLGWGYGFGSLCQFDQNENMYFASASCDNRFPVINGRPANTINIMDGMVILGTLSREGDLLFSTYVGDTFDQFVQGLVVDSCGRAVVFGRRLSIQKGNFPLVDPLYDEGHNYLTVIDTRTGNFEFSTLIPWQQFGNGWGGWGGWVSGGICLSGSSVYLLSTSNDSLGLPATPGLRGYQPSKDGDAMITRIDIPLLCGKELFPLPRMNVADLSTTVLYTDTLRIDMSRRSVSPPFVRISGTIHNLSDRNLADLYTMRLELPPGLQPASGSLPLTVRLGSPTPGDSLSFVWILDANIDSIAPTSVLHGVLISSSGGPCPVPIYLPFDIPVIYTSIPEAELYCNLSILPDPVLNPEMTRLLNDTLLLNLQITNFSTGPGKLKHVELRIPSNSGITLLSPTDPVAIPPLIPGKGVIGMQWLLLVESWPSDRRLPISAVLVDTFDLIVADCELWLTIPGSRAGTCSLTANGPVHYRADDQTYAPDPVEVRLTIGNLCDSLRFYHDLRLDLSNAPHLKVETGETLQRPDFTIPEKGSREFSWALNVAPPPVQSVTEVVRVRYWVNADTAEQMCDVLLDIVLLSSKVSCTISCIDSLTIDPASGRLTPDTVTINAVLRNTGELPQELRDVRLLLPPNEGAVLLDSASRTIPPIGAGSSITVEWRLRIPIYKVDRRIKCEIIIRAPDGQMLSSCMDIIFVPSLILGCSLSAPDSIRYEIASDTYDPPEFDVTAKFENRTDTVLTNLRAVLDTTILQRARLLDAATAEQFLPQLQPGQTWDVRWTLAPLWADVSFDQRFRVGFFADYLPVGTLCEQMTAIGGAPRTVSLRCETAGHDSVWADTFYEKLIPNPVQLQYTLHNVGNTTASSCALAIVPPPMLELVAGEDSIRIVPTLLPGESFSAEWQLRVIEEKVTPEPWIVRWHSDCEGLDASSQCEHAITLVMHSPAGLVVTPWLLRFAAEQGGTLPPAKTIDLWTGGGNAPQWNVASTPSWLDASPFSGAGHTIMSAVPNTTALTPGAHSGTLALSEVPLSTGQIQVVYDIRTKLGAETAPPPAATRIGTLYPNPVPAGAPLTVGYLADPGTSVRCEIHDLLGRVRSTAAQETTASGSGNLRMPTTGLQPGTYVLTLRARGRSDVRLLMVIQ